MNATPRPARAPDWAATVVARQQEKIKPTTLNIAHTADKSVCESEWGSESVCEREREIMWDKKLSNSVNWHKFKSKPLYRQNLCTWHTYEEKGEFTTCSHVTLWRATANKDDSVRALLWQVLQLWLLPHLHLQHTLLLILLWLGVGWQWHRLWIRQRGEFGTYTRKIKHCTCTLVSTV